MQSRNAAYNAIMADPAHSAEWRITINGTVYGQESIVYSAGSGSSAPRIVRSMFSGGEPEVGKAVAATFSCAVMTSSSSVPRMAAVVPSYRLRLGSSLSDWYGLGTFYIDTRTVDKVTGALMLTCYDAMLKADGIGGAAYKDVTAFSTWPQSMSAVAAEIAGIMGVTLDARTTIHTGTGYTVAYPNDLTMREVLGYIAAAHAGNWCVTHEGKLRLVPITGTGDALTVGAAAAGLRTSPALTAWSGVTVYWSDEEAFIAGDSTGRVMTLDCPWATQATANGILSAISGHAYQPYTAAGAVIDLALELGDTVTVGAAGDTVSGPVFSIDTAAGLMEQAQLAAPGEDEIDHEYPYVSRVDRSLKRKVTLGQSYYGTSISRENGIEIARSDGKSEAVFNSDTFAMRALVDGTMKDRIYFDPIKGDYVFDGALGANAVFTDSLYAEQGDIADLTVDRLSTSRRVRKYILGDISDDNYVRIQDQHIEFVTGTLFPAVNLLSEAGAFLLTEDEQELLMDGRIVTPPVQVLNRYGQALYWQREPVGHTSEGYPTDADGVQIYATTDVTSWPVYTYEYTELVKSKFSFEEYVTSQGDNTYAPIIVLGAGDRDGNSKGFIQKEQNGMTISYLTNSGTHTDIRMGDYVDAKHRRLSSCIINTVTGGIEYTVEGSDEVYMLSYATDGDSIIYTWPDDHTCTITFDDGEEEE